MDDVLSRADGEPLMQLLDACARVLYRDPDPEAFLAWIAETGPALMPGLPSSETTLPGQVFRALGVEIYNAMPLPAASFRPRKLPLPGRNAPCLCGSGRKYKHCCLPLSGVLDLAEYNLLRVILEQLPVAEFARLPHTRVDLDDILDTAGAWHDDGHSERAAALLEPWFDDERLPETLDLFFDELMACYETLGDAPAMRELIARCIARGDGPLRSIALQRAALMHADAGETAQAWTHFEQALRAAPEHPGLATLEMTLLVAQGELDQARSRARFWITRFERLRDPGLAELLDFLYAAESDPAAAVHSLERGHDLDETWPACDELAGLLTTAPPPAPRYTLRARGPATFELVVDETVQALEQRWHQAYLQPKPLGNALASGSDEMWEDSTGWLRFLSRHPEAWQSLDVLDDLLVASTELPPGSAHDALGQALFTRAAAIIDALYAELPADGLLPWTWLRNRPLLRLLAQGASLPPSAAVPNRDAQFLQHAERLLALDPSDPFELREALMRGWLEAGRPEAVLALAAHFPDDYCGPALNRLLALLRSGAEAEASHYLASIAPRHGAAIELLLAAETPRRPRVEHGRADDERLDAWYYREQTRRLWLEGAALAWLQVAWGRMSG